MSVMLLGTKRERVLLRNSYRLQILIVSNIARIAKVASHKSPVKPSINVSTVLPVPSCPVLTSAQRVPEPDPLLGISFGT